MSDALPDKAIYCHLTGFSKRCYDMVTKYKCRKWVHYLGHDPQTNKSVDIYDCRDHVDHKLQIETIKAILTTTGSVDQFRKEVAVQNDATMVTILKQMNDRLEDQQLIASNTKLLDKKN